MCAVLPINCLIRLGSLDARQLHDDAAVALAGDLRIDHTGFVDAAADDLDRLVDRAGRALRAAPPATGSA